MSSPSQRPVPDNTQHSQQTNIHAPDGIRTHARSRRAAVDRAATGTGPQSLILDRNMIIWTFHSSTILWHVLFLNIKHVKQSLFRSLRVPGVQAPRFQENRHTKWVRFSVQHTNRLYPLEVFLALIFVRSWVDPRGHSAVRKDYVNEKFQWHLESNPRLQALAQCLNQLRHRVRLF